ncbi:MAG TPA: DUF6282 family protein [Candidatus Dormibacteraeota bacterium]|nr:DUF6282 family protein [Candidatus Dormibacteraeota bacterium]
MLNDAIDLHVHAGPELFRRSGDAIDYAEQAKDRGMCGLLLKCHHESTVTRAYFARRAVPEIEVWGGIVLNSFVGGINPVAVGAAFDLGARFVWMPTMHASHHAGHVGLGTYGIPNMTVSADATPHKGLTVLDDAGKLTAEATAVIGLVAKRGGALGSAHLGPEETRAVVAECQRVGARCVVTHAFFLGQTMEFLVEMAGLGAYIEISAAASTAIVRHLMGESMSLAQARDLIGLVGPEAVVVSSDAGMPEYPRPVELLESFALSLHAIGVSNEDLRTMMVDVPRRVLGLA